VHQSGSHTGKRLGCRQEDNINIYLKEKCVDWIQLSQCKAMGRAALKTIINLRVLQKAGNLLTG
jgi:hypothetical protein